MSRAQGSGGVATRRLESAAASGVFSRWLRSVLLAKKEEQKILDRVIEREASAAP